MTNSRQPSIASTGDRSRPGSHPSKSLEDSDRRYRTGLNTRSTVVVDTPSTLAKLGRVFTRTLQVAAVVGLLALLGAAILDEMDRPQVHRRVGSLECVRVVNAAPRFSCDNLPPKYDHVWVD